MRRANRLKSFPESRPFPDFFISTLLHVSTSFLLPIFLRASVGSFIPHYLVARVFRPIPARALLKRVFSDGKDTGCALLRGTIDDWVHWETLRIYYTGRFRWNRNKKKNCGVEWKSESVKNIRATIFNVPSFLFYSSLAVELLLRGKKIRIDSYVSFARKKFQDRFFENEGFC